jgi:DNA polymerase-3 subunit beta
MIAAGAAACAILSNEKYRDPLALKPSALTIQAHNPEQEEAEEEVEVNYDGEELEIGFNVNYLPTHWRQSRATTSPSGLPTAIAAA